jgi:hypothetical protein
MNCREAQSYLFADRDDVLETQRVALDSHVAECTGCRRMRENLGAALTAWRVEVHQTTVPNVEREWYAVRRRIRGGVESGEVRLEPSRRNLFTWFAVPVGAAAALAFAFFVMPSSTNPVAEHAEHVARANSVQVPGNNAATMVFVDDKSGWLFVLASDEAAPKRG